MNIGCDYKYKFHSQDKIVMDSGMVVCCSILCDQGQFLFSEKYQEETGDSHNHSLMHISSIQKRIPLIHETSVVHQLRGFFSECNPVWCEFNFVPNRKLL